MFDISAYSNVITWSARCPHRTKPTVSICSSCRFRHYLLSYQIGYSNSLSCIGYQGNPDGSVHEVQMYYMSRLSYYVTQSLGQVSWKGWEIVVHYYLAGCAVLAETLTENPAYRQTYVRIAQQECDNIEQRGSMALSRYYRSPVKMDQTFNCPTCSRNRKNLP